VDFIPICIQTGWLHTIGLCYILGRILSETRFLSNPSEINRQKHTKLKKNSVLFHTQYIQPRRMSKSFPSFASFSPSPAECIQLMIVTQRNKVISTCMQQ